LVNFIIFSFRTTDAVAVDDSPKAASAAERIKCFMVALDSSRL
jgi:hypothetical protein